MEAVVTEVELVSRMVFNWSTITCHDGSASSDLFSLITSRESTTDVHALKVLWCLVLQRTCVQSPSCHWSWLLQSEWSSYRVGTKSQNGFCILSKIKILLNGMTDFAKLSRTNFGVHKHAEEPRKLFTCYRRLLTPNTVPGGPMW